MAKQTEEFSLDSILSRAEELVTVVPGENNGAHLHRLLKMALDMGPYAGKQPDAEFQEMLAVRVAVWLMLSDGFLSASPLQDFVIDTFSGMADSARSKRDQ